MPTFKITAAGKSYNITAPDQASAVAAFQKFSGAGAPQSAYQPQTFNGPGGQNTVGLAMPGTTSPGYTNGVDPHGNRDPGSMTFGPSDGTLNPLPAISAFADSAVGQLPFGAGQALQGVRDNVNAWANGGSPQQSRADMNKMVDANPVPSVAGAAIGATAPYMVAGEVPLLAKGLGMEGPLLQRLAVTGASQYGINTADNVAKGQSLPQAAQNAVLPSLLSVPFAVFGRGRSVEGERGDAIKYLQDQGVPLSAGQQRASRSMMMTESQLGGAAAQSFTDKQLSAYTRAALKTAGVDAASASPVVMDKAFTDIGHKFNSLASLTKTRIDPQLQNDMLKAATDYQDITGQSLPVLEKFIARVGNMHAQGAGVMSGDSYKALSTEIGEKIKGTSNPELKTALINMKEGLDNAVGRSMSGKTLEAWQKTRQQYANLMRITDAVDGAGGYAAQGLVTPEALSQAVRARNAKQYVRGYGDLNELARSGVIAMPRLPDSGTASRLGALAFPAAMSAGGAAMSASNNPYLAAAAAGSVLAPSIVGKAMLSAPGRAMLSTGTAVPSIVARGDWPYLLSGSSQQSP